MRLHLVHAHYIRFRYVSFSEIILIDKITRGMLGVTLFLVVILGVWIWAAATQPDPTILRVRTTINPKGEVQAGKSRVVQTREPASKSPMNVETYDLGCLKKSPHKLAVESFANQVRIKARFCDGQNANLEASSVINKTNGYDGSLFRLEGSGVTTDYLTLTEGVNQIFLDLAADAGGSAFTEITISRK